MTVADEKLGVERITALCKQIVADGRMVNNCKYCVLLLLFEEEGDPMDYDSYRASISC